MKIGVQETDAEHEMEMKLEMKSLSPGKAAGGFFLAGFFVRVFQSHSANGKQRLNLWEIPYC